MNHSLQCNSTLHFLKSDRKANGGGILVYERDDIPCKLIPVRNSTIESFFTELKVRKKKWLLCFPTSLIKNLFLTI